MAINIIDLYLKNAPGALSEVTAFLEKESIDIHCIANSGEEDYIPVSLVVSHTEKAVHDLAKLGYELDVEEGVACEIPHHPGGLNSVVRILADNNINIISIFSAPSRIAGTAIAVLRVNDTDLAEDVLKRNWIKLLDVQDMAV